MGAKKVKSTQVFIAAAIMLIMLIATVFCVGLMVKYEVLTDVSKIEIVHYWKGNLPKEQEIWYDNGIEELQFAIKLIPTTQKARNVLVFVANGITRDALAAVRFRNKQQGNKDMIWDLFPYIAKLQNSCSSSDKCDASTISTALFGGIKTNFGVGGLDSSVTLGDCLAANNESHYVSSIIADAQSLGLRTGLVTTGRLTAPFLAPLYAHTADSSWECDSTVPSEYKGVCSDVAQQLVNNTVAKNLNVIIGGGRQTLVSNTLITANDPIDETACRSTTFKRNLIRDWTYEQLAKNRIFNVAHNENELDAINGSYVDYALGVFGNGQISTNKTQFQQVMTKTIDILQRDDSGYMLFVNTFMKFNETMQLQIEKLKLLNDIMEYTFKLPKYNKDETLTLVVFTQDDYKSPTTNPPSLLQSLETESLESKLVDTLVFANGPKSYLFHGVREEIYLKYALSYITKLDSPKHK